jgi:hypothetical protein
MRGLSHSVNLKGLERKWSWSVSMYSPGWTEINHEEPQESMYPVEIRTMHLLNRSQKHQLNQVAR